MKAAQVSGGPNNNGNPGGHSGLLTSSNIQPSSPSGPQSQNMMQGRIKLEGKKINVNKQCSFKFIHKQPANRYAFKGKLFIQINHFVCTKL